MSNPPAAIIASRLVKCAGTPNSSATLIKVEASRPCTATTSQILDSCNAGSVRLRPLPVHDTTTTRARRISSLLTPKLRAALAEPGRFIRSTVEVEHTLDIVLLVVEAERYFKDAHPRS